MAIYADGTAVSVPKSFDEIRRTLERFGASAFGFAEEGRNVEIRFKVKGYQILLRMVLPSRADFAKDSFGGLRSTTAVDKDHGAACRQLWRVMALGIKAKLAMVEAGFHSLEEEFLADVVTVNGETVGDLMVSELERTVRFAEMPSLAPGRRGVIALGSGE